MLAEQEVKTSEDNVHWKPEELRVMFLKGCDTRLCKETDELSEVCLRGASLRLLAGQAWRRWQKSVGTHMEGFYKTGFQHSKKRYLRHVYKGAKTF